MDKIAPIRSDVVISEGKQCFLDTVADAFDEVTGACGSEPVCVVYALVTLDGKGRTGYHSLGPCDTDGRGTSLYVDRGLAMLTRDAAEWDKASNGS